MCTELCVYACAQGQEGDRGTGQVHPVSVLTSCCSETSMVSRKGTESPAGVTGGRVF